MTNKAGRLEKLMAEMLEVYKAKNKDYGDSFSKSFEEFGLIAPVVRMNDKMNRIKSLSKKGGRQVKGESLRDSLMDLANYAMMTVIELENEQMRGVKGEPGMRVTRDTFDINEFREDLKSGFTITHNGKPLKALFEELSFSDDEHDWINDRFSSLEDDKKYYLRAMLSGIDEDENYLNLDIHGSGFTLNNNEDATGYKTEFTKDEIKNLIINWDVDLDDFEIKEVESDYEAGRQENL